MPAWTDYKAIAAARGALVCEVFVVVSTPSKPPEALQAVLPDHLAYIAGLERSGALMLAGPMSDDTGEEMQGSGMIVLRAASMDEARDLAANDPMHATGARTFTLRKWLINEGRVTVSVGLSTGERALG